MTGMLQLQRFCTLISDQTNAKSPHVDSTDLTRAIEDFSEYVGSRDYERRFLEGFKYMPDQWKQDMRVIDAISIQKLLGQ
jgi:hypothetical protein